MWHRRPTIALTTALAATIASAELNAQTTLELSPSPALWRDQVVATISGVGCSGETAPPFISFHSPSVLIDIDLEDCDGSATPFSTQVVLPDLLPGRYLVRAQDAIRHIVSPPPPPLAVAPLEVSRDASITIDLPALATSGQPFEIELAAPDNSGCQRSFSGPQVTDRQLRFELLDCVQTLPTPQGILRERSTVGPLPAGDYDVLVYDMTQQLPQYDLPAPFVRKALVVHDAQGCVPGATVLCLQNGRFSVQAAATSASTATELLDFGKQGGLAGAVALEGSDDSGLFSFFADDNVELTVKVLDGCGINGNYWVFIAPGTTLPYTVTVTDTVSATSRSYDRLGGLPSLVHDTGAFTCD